MLPTVYKLLGHFTIFTAISGSIFAVDFDFRSQVTLGSIIVAALILAVAGLTTIRSKIANIWKEEAEGERAAKERLQEELNAEKLSRAEFEKEQQELRHDLKDKIAELSAQLRVMEAKTDLSSVLDIITKNSVATQENHNETHRLLEEIRDKLPDEPISAKIVEDETKG